MKHLNINNKVFQYKICSDVSEYDTYYWTEFYDGVIIKKYKKYFLFGPILTKEVPKLVFKLPLNIEDISYTKNEIRAKIEKKIELLDRQAEIDKGIII